MAAITLRPRQRPSSYHRASPSRQGTAVANSTSQNCMGLTATMAPAASSSGEINTGSPSRSPSVTRNIQSAPWRASRVPSAGKSICSVLPWAGANRQTH